MTAILAGLRSTKSGGAGGVFRGEGDAAWERTLEADVQAITPDPRDPEVVLAGTVEGVWRSTDQGHSWKHVHGTETQVWSIAFDPADPRTVYAGTSPVGMLRSEDGGQTFRAMPAPVLPEHVKMSFACR